MRYMEFDNQKLLRQDEITVNIDHADLRLFAYHSTCIGLFGYVKWAVRHQD